MLRSSDAVGCACLLLSVAVACPWLACHLNRCPLCPPWICREKEAHNRAVVLEMIGDLPEAEAKPPPNMLFICKLNPVGMASASWPLGCLGACHPTPDRSPAG